MAAEATGAEGFGEAAGGDSTTLEWASPGVSLRKRILTGVGVALVAALFLFIAWYENASMLVSTLIGLVFIGCFIWYLRIVAPTPYTIRLDDNGIARTERGAEAQTIPWTSIARIKKSSRTEPPSASRSTNASASATSRAPSSSTATTFRASTSFWPPCAPICRRASSGGARRFTSSQTTIRPQSDLNQIMRGDQHGHS